MKYRIRTIACLFAETKCTAYGSRFSWGTLMYKNFKFVKDIMVHHTLLAHNRYVEGWPNTDCNSQANWDKPEPSKSVNCKVSPNQ